MRARVPLELWPALDVRGGRVAQVAAASPLADPVAAMEHWLSQGAERLHLVDLDRATGQGHNDAVLADLVRRSPVPVEVSGGLLTADDLARPLDWGAVAVTTSSALWGDPRAAERLLARTGTEVQVGLDLDGDRVVARGTRLDLGPVDRLWPVLERLGERRWVVASASRDGRMTGPDLPGLQAAAHHLRGALVASGGVAGTGDLIRLSSLRGPHGPAVDEVILGAALYEGAVELRTAQRLLRGTSRHESGATADSAGNPWAGRELVRGPFDGDQGEADPRLAAALGDGAPTGAAGDSAVVEALGAARVFVALVAQEGADSADMAVAHLTTPQGWSALPVFTTPEAVSAWRAEARPVPVPGQQAAQAAVQDGVAALVLDPGSSAPRVVRPSMVRAVARGIRWEAPTQDPVVIGALRELKGRQGVEGVALRLGPGGELVVGLRGIEDDRTAGALVAGAMGDPEVRSRVDQVVVSALGLVSRGQTGYPDASK